MNETATNETTATTNGTHDAEIVASDPINPWKIGDVVELKSGGPRMCVSAVDLVSVTTNWFDGTAVLHVGDFDMQTIKGADADKPKRGRPPKKGKRR